MSSFNELLHGSAEEAADHLHYESDVSEAELRAALTNALRKINRLENRKGGIVCKRHIICFNKIVSVSLCDF